MTTRASVYLPVSGCPDEQGCVECRPKIHRGSDSAAQVGNDDYVTNDTAAAIRQIAVGTMGDVHDAVVATEIGHPVEIDNWGRPDVLYVKGRGLWSLGDVGSAMGLALLLTRVSRPLDCSGPYGERSACLYRAPASRLFRFAGT